jgi:hypothetical protein
MSSDFPITPKTKVAALLEHHPELEDVLIGMAPPFKKLRNPILRRSVAKVTSLQQAAAVGRVSVEELVNTLRAAVGQKPISAEANDDAAPYFSSQPEWFDEEKVVASIVEEELDPEVMPLNPLVRRATELREGEIVELVTAYLPAPGIDIMRGKGFRVWVVEEGELIKTYFSKSTGQWRTGCLSPADDPGSHHDIHYSDAVDLPSLQLSQEQRELGRHVHGSGRSRQPGPAQPATERRM